MGNQGAISSDGRNRIAKLDPRQPFCIPSVQFAILLTGEVQAGRVSFKMTHDGLVPIDLTLESST